MDDRLAESDRDRWTPANDTEEALAGSERRVSPLTHRFAVHERYPQPRKHSTRSCTVWLVDIRVSIRRF